MVKFLYLKVKSFIFFTIELNISQLKFTKSKNATLNHMDHNTRIWNSGEKGKEETGNKNLFYFHRRPVSWFLKKKISKNQNQTNKKQEVKAIR